MSITGIFDVKAYGATGNGTTDDSAAVQRTIQAAMASNSGGKIIYFPEGRYRIESYLTINHPALVWTGNNATLTTNAASRYLTIQSGLEISNLILDKYYLYLPSTHKNSGKMFIRGNMFKNSPAQAIISDAGAEMMPSNIEISSNSFDNCCYAVYGSYSNSIIADNTIQNSINRNIEIASGSNNLITGNRISSGVTGICFLLNRKSTQGIGLDNNVISNNRISNISEEAISLDIHGNNSGSSGSVVKGTVSSVTVGNSQIRIVPSFRLDNPSNGYKNLYVVFLSGKTKGQALKIDSMGPDGKSYLQLVGGNAKDIAVGDRIVLQVGVVGTIISNNTISNAQTGIDLYGVAMETVVSGNHIDTCKPDGIRVSSLYGVLDGSYGMVFNNTITSNILKDANINVGIITFGPPIDVYASGNQVISNTLINGNLLYSYQDEVLVSDNVVAGSGVTSIANCSTSLPVPSQKYLSQQRFLKGKAGTEDSVYVCVQTANGTYQWKALK